MKWSVAAAVCAYAASVTALTAEETDTAIGSTHADDTGSSYYNVAEQWWDSLESMPGAVKSLAETLQRSAVDATVSATQQIHDRAAEALESMEHHHPRHGRGKKKKHAPKLTTYQKLQKLDHASEFTKLLKDFPDLIETLNSTDSEHTLFVPLDSAFEKIPDKFKHPSREHLEKFLQYHIVSGTQKAKDVLTSYTLESELSEPLLGDEHQRIRVGASLAGVTLNGYSKIRAVNIETTNGVIHAISDILAPPPPVGPILTFLPAYFSTLLLAYEKTDFVKFVHSQHVKGVTLFAPTNSAFKKLGVRANAFLFNTKRGAKYLEAILKYSITPNATVYSDAFYDKTTSSGFDVDAAGRQDHYSLETFLPGASLGVDIGSFWGFRVITINGFTGVSFRDAIGSNGVLHAVDKVILPPHNGKHADATDISVQELQDRLSAWVTDEDADDEPSWEEL